MFDIEGQRDEILSEFARVRSPFKVAKNLGYDIGVVWNIIDANPDQILAQAERYGGEGRPDLRPFIVAKKRRGTVWDNDEAGIAKARANYEAGTHDMTTHYDGPHAFLVSKPHRWPSSPRTDYFKPEL